MKPIKLLSLLSAALALVMLALPCSATAEETFSKWKTIPTEDLEMNVYPVEKSPIYQKSAVFFGDSLCNARGESESSDATVRAKAGYAGRIGTKYSMTFYKEGYSGYAFSASGRGKIGAKIDDFIQKYPNEKIDYVILEGGGNDAWDQTAIGSVSASFNQADFDTTTYAGAVERAVATLKQAYPKATIGFIIIYKMPIAYYGGQEIQGLRDNAKMEPYMNTLIEICEKWELPYIDFYHDDSFNNDVLKTNTNTYTSDGIHVNSAGYDILSDYIAAWMEEPERRAPQPQKPIETPDMDLNDPDENPQQGETPDAEIPEEDPKDPEVPVGAIIGGAAAAVVASGVAVGTALSVNAKKKKKS